MYIYELTQKVRDYECDLQGIVNNSVYQNYLEHTRHEWLEEIGLSFAEMHDEGIDAVVAKAELEYKSPLKSGDWYVSGLNVELVGKLRYVFHQEIRRKSDGKLMVKGTITSTTTKVENGRPCFYPKLAETFEKYAGNFPKV
ncbi:MAG: acyl-CoA thioesterase [Mangrovibacterium sp.]